MAVFVKDPFSTASSTSMVFRVKLLLARSHSWTNVVKKVLHWSISVLIQCHDSFLFWYNVVIHFSFVLSYLWRGYVLPCTCCLSASVGILGGFGCPAEPDYKPTITMFSGDYFLSCIQWVWNAWCWVIVPDILYAHMFLVPWPLLSCVIFWPHAISLESKILLSYPIINGQLL